MKNNKLCIRYEDALKFIIDFIFKNLYGQIIIDLIKLLKIDMYNTNTPLPNAKVLINYIFGCTDIKLSKIIKYIINNKYKITIIHGWSNDDDQILYKCIQNKPTKLEQFGFELKDLLKKYDI